MSDIRTMLKKLNMYIVSEAIDEESKENVFVLMYEPTEEVKIFRYTDIVDAYVKKIKGQFEF